jgi:hypothetical protein
MPDVLADQVAAVEQQLLAGIHEIGEQEERLAAIHEIFIAVGSAGGGPGFGEGLFFRLPTSGKS